jgi:hypothetical protein
MKILNWLIGRQPKQQEGYYEIFCKVIDANARAKERRVDPARRKWLYDAGLDFYLRGDLVHMKSVVECLDFLTRGGSRRCKRRRGVKP